MDQAEGATLPKIFCSSNSIGPYSGVSFIYRTAAKLSAALDGRYDLASSQLIHQLLFLMLSPID